MTDLPAPLADADLDVRELEEMPLNVRRLRDSSTAATASAEGFRAAVLLWAAAWHQVPAGSLPAGDAELAALAGFGRDVAGFQAVRADALRGFLACRDGRLYHQVIVDYAETAAAQIRAARRLSKINRAKGKKSGQARRALASPAATRATGYDPAPAGALEFTHVDPAGQITAGTVEPAGKTGDHQENASAESQQQQGVESHGSTAAQPRLTSGSAAVPPPPAPPSPSPLKNPLTSTPSPSSPSKPGSGFAVPVAAAGADPAPDLLEQLVPGGKVTVQRDPASASAPCPVQEIVELYNEILGDTLPATRVFSEGKRRQLTTRWREDKKRQNLSWWRGYFEHVRDECPFLMGRTRHGFLANLGWLVGPENFAKVVNGNYAVDRDNKDNGGGRR